MKHNSLQTRLLALVLTGMLMFSLFWIPSAAEPITPDTSWYSADQTEFTITTAAQLLGIKSVGTDFAGKIIKLGADITLNEGKNTDWAITAPANTLGASLLDNFSGTFDGQNHTISGLYLSSDSGCGMFLSAGNGATIKNLKIVNSFASGKSNAVGLLTGQLYGGNCTISNVTVDAYVSAAGVPYVGMLSGWAHSVSTVIDNCKVSGTVEGGTQVGAVVGIVSEGSSKVEITNTEVRAAITSTGDEVGGFIGRVGLSCTSSATLTNCAFTGTLNGGNFAGGMIGKLNNDASATLTECEVDGSVTGAKFIGGLVGYAYAAKANFTDCIFSGTVDSSVDYIGGMIGKAEGASIVSFVRCTGAGTLKPTYPYGSLAGGSYTSNVTVTDCHGVTTNPIGEPTNSVFNGHAATSGDGTCFAEALNNIGKNYTLLGVPIAADTSWLQAGVYEYTLTTAEQLQALNDLASANGNWAGYTFHLGNDIVVNTGKAADWSKVPAKNKWTPISSFKGTLNGDGHTISGLYIHGGGGSALIAIADGATVKNLNVNNSYVYGTGNPVAMIAGHAYGAACTFQSISVDAIVNGMSVYNGGIVGWIHETNGTTSLVNCDMSGSVRGGTATGGLIGFIEDNNSVSVSGCINAATVETTGDYAGGIVGLARANPNSTFTDCVVLAPVSGGAAGAFAGGFGSSNITITNCYSAAGLASNPVAAPTNASFNGSAQTSEAQFLEAVGTNYRVIDLSMLDGAAIRTTTGSTGIRWKTQITRQFVDLIAARNDLGFEIGTVIAPAQFADAAGGMTQDKLAAAGKVYREVSANIGHWYSTSENAYVFAGSIAISNVNHFNLEYASNGYFRLTFGCGATFTLNAAFDRTTNARSVAYIANAALMDADNGLTPQQIANIQAYADAYDEALTH